MNKELKAKWVEALRSGKYKQGRVKLNQGGHWCCLGVLCDLNDASLWCDTGGYIHPGSACFPPEEIFKSLDIPESKGWELVNLNDSARKSFDEIANFIESDL